MDRKWVDLWQQRLHKGLYPLGILYGSFMKLRSFAYENKILKSWNPPGLCVSVGNLSWGGSGKTPLCQWLIAFFEDKNQKVCLLTRGYKGHNRSLPFLVYPHSSVTHSGDEPLMLARAHSTAYIVVDPKRQRAGKWIAHSFAPDVFLLDDGFQHLGVERDIDLVILGERDVRSQWGQILPAGQWREDSSALSRASALMLHIKPEHFEDIRSDLTDRLGGFHKPLFSFFLRYKGLQRVTDHEFCPIPLKGPYLLVSGVGNPQSVEVTACQAMGQQPRRHIVFPDHHWFSSRDWRELQEESDAQGCSTILCTQKDSVKLEKFADSRLWSIQVEVHFGPCLWTALAFDEWLRQNMISCNKPER
jgi:tetraacyldisaccharide 4'-kinase